MSSAIPDFLASASPHFPFRNASVRRHGAADSQSTKLDFRISQIFSSKRLRIVLVSTLILLLLFLSTAYLRDGAFTPYVIPPGSVNSLSLANSSNARDEWSRFAYAQYATNSAYLCNSVMLFKILHRFGNKADRLLMYPSGFQIQEGDDEATESRLLRKARDQYNVKLKPIEIQRTDTGDATWAESFTKLLAFNQTQYERIIHLDSDATLLHPMDELFTLPPTPVAIPRAYWLGFDKRVMTSTILVVQPSKFEYSRIAKAIAAAQSNEYDMEIMNNLYQDSALILPHRPYVMITSELYELDHAGYLGNHEETWDPDAAMREVKLIHFSDWPVPKPWFKADSQVVDTKVPPCPENPNAEQKVKCRGRELWLDLHSDFRKRRKEVCDIDV